MAFERSYTFCTFLWQIADLTAGINDAVAKYDHPDAAASVACMSVDERGVHILIEYWRFIDNGHRKQTPEGSMDSGTEARKSRRPRAKADDHSGATQRDQSKGIGVTLDANGEVDVPLPFDADAVSTRRAQMTNHARSCSFWRSAMLSDCDCSVASRRVSPSDIVHPHPPIEYP